MEVESQTLPTFNLQSKPSFPFVLDLGNESQECSNTELSFSSNHDIKSMVSDDKVCKSSESSPAPDQDLKSTETDSEKYADSESSAALTEKKGQDCSKSSKCSVSLSHSVNLTAIQRQESGVFESSAALKVQKVYRSYRTRRRLADSAVVAEELWWQAIDYVRLNHSTISFFNFSKPETAASRWNRVSLNASKVGKGLSKDAKALKLAFQHWIEAIDPRHRYGHGLHLYYEVWCKADAGQPFFFWLDIGDGRDVDLKEYPRSNLRQQCIKYLGPQEREYYEYIVVEGKIVHKQTGELLDTFKGSQAVKWIFVMSTSKKLYAGEKKKGIFHHSSFLAGGATLAAGRLVARDGVFKSISAYSGHYRPTEENLDNFLALLKENGVNLDEVQIRCSEDYENYEDKSVRDESMVRVPIDPEQPQLEIPNEMQKDQPSEPPKAAAQTEISGSYQRTLSGGLHSPRAEVPKKVILQRINSKKAASSYQLGHQLSLKWSTGAGPRIGCIADYPMELRAQALEFVNLSPRVPPTPSSLGRLGGLVSPMSRPTSDFCNGDVTSNM